MEQDRRKFVTSALAAAPLFVPRSAWGANDRLAFGLIGAGGRGRYLTAELPQAGRRVRGHRGSLRAATREAALKIAPAGQDLRRLPRSAAAAGRGRRGGGHARPPALPQPAGRARGEEGRLPREAHVALARGEPADDPGRARAPSRSCRSACSGAAPRPCIKGKEIIDSGVLGKITLVKPMWNWNVSQAAQQLAAARQARLEALPRRRRRRATSSPCGSAPGATSGITPAAT